MTEPAIASHLLARARRAAEHLRAVCRVVALIAPLVPHSKEREELEALQKKLEAGFNALVLLDGKKLADALDPLERGAQQLEGLVEKLDGGIPMGWFRANFDPSKASSVALADYVTVLGRHAGDEAARLDRIQFLLTRLLSFFVSPEEESPALRRQLLAEALPPSQLDEATRASVVTFFHDATRRLSSFTSLKDLTDSGFFVDVRGYKLSLREKLLDPDVMVAIIELNEATTVALDRLAAAEQQGKELEEHLAEVDQRIKAIFASLRTDESAQTRRFESWLTAAARARAAGKEPPRLEGFVDLTHSPQKDRKLLLGAVALLLFLWLLFRIPVPQKLHEMSASECQTVSQLVTSCAVAPAGRPTVYLGQVDKARWALLDQRERREAAIELASRVKQRGWSAATVLLEGQVVMQVQDGQVLVVQ